MKFFKSQADFRKWLEKNHDKVSELQVAYYKKDTGKKSITYPESLDEALCFGWIDGIRKRIDEESYTIRFTPRKLKSTWSKVNINRINELQELGLVTKQGLRCFEDRDQDRSGYSLKERPTEIPPKYEKRFKANKKAWEFFQAQAPWYRRNVMWWVTSAKQEETREKRFAQLIQDCSNEVRIGLMVLLFKEE